MRLLDESSDKKLNEILIFFTKDEASEMLEVLKDFLAGGTPDEDHYHLHSKDLKKEITIVLYDENDRNSWSHFNPRCQKLIEEDI